jgi:hypothetical protein
MCISAGRTSTIVVLRPERAENNRPRCREGRERAGEIRPFAFDPGVGLVCHRIGYPPIADDHFTGGLNWKGVIPRRRLR